MVAGAPDVHARLIVLGTCNGAAALVTIGSYAPNANPWPAAMVQLALTVADTAIVALVELAANALPAAKTTVHANARTFDFIIFVFKVWSP
jgi:hypothetical protein